MMEFTRETAFDRLMDPRPDADSLRKHLRCGPEDVQLQYIILVEEGSHFNCYLGCC